jgi:hypothetical protein
VPEGLTRVLQLKALVWNWISKDEVVHMICEEDNGVVTSWIKKESDFQYLMD